MRRTVGLGALLLTCGALLFLFVVRESREVMTPPVPRNEDKPIPIGEVKSLESQPAPTTTQDKVFLTKAKTRADVKVTLPDGTTYAWSSESSISTNEPVEMTVQELSEEVRSMVQDDLKGALGGVHELLRGD